VVDEDAEIADKGGEGDTKVHVRSAQVEVREGGPVSSDSPLGVVKGNELCFVWVNPETVSGKPARHVLKALGS
jgi:hypothetical protein